MSRIIPDKPKSHLTYEAAEKFKQIALIGGRSLFLPDKRLWIPEHFEPLVTHYVDNPIVGSDDERGSKFWEKLPHQVGRCPPESVALCAEIYWSLVFVSSFLKGSKIKRLKELWGMAKEPLPKLDVASPFLDKDTMLGVGSTGTAYNVLLWMELSYAIRLFKSLAEMTVPERETLLADPWAFAKWMDKLDETGGRQFYHILCHALFPDSFERIFSEGGKETLARNPTFGVPKSARASRPARDEALLEVRQRLEAEHAPRQIDYYVFPPLLAPDESKKKRGRPPKGSHSQGTPFAPIEEVEADDELDAEAEVLTGAIKPWRPRNRIFFGPPGSGKTWVMETIRARRYRNGERVVFVSFHPSYSYEDFVEGYRPAPGQGGRLGETPEPGPFREICESAHRHPDVRHTLFIDEINRANVAKVFGELITLLEPSKRCSPTPNLDFSEARSAARLQYSGEILAVPANLDIVASMNTADRSVQSIDRALRRRFEFIETPADPRALPKEKVGGVDLRALLSAINDRIEFLLDREHAIGHALLIGVRNIWDLRRAFSRRVIPLLQEYFFDDPAKAKLALTGSNKPSIFYVERELDAAALFDSSADIDGQEARVSIRPSADLAEWKAADFIGLYLRGEILAAAIADLPVPVSPDEDEGDEEEFEDLDEFKRIEDESAEELGPAAADANPADADASDPAA